MAANIKRGDVVMVNLGTVNDIKGHEQALTRPCIVIKTFDHFGLAVIVPFSKHGKASAHYSIVKVPAGTGGLGMDSYALCHQIRSVSFDRLGRHIGALPTVDFNKVMTVLADMLDL